MSLFLLGVGWVLAGPAFAEKEIIGGQDLDRVSAAGVCGVGARACDAPEDSGAAQASMITQDTIGAQFVFSPQYHLTLTGGAQQGTRALVLNNAVGTNQVANGINISGTGSR